MVVCGIDLGTTNSAIAVYENGAPKIIENSEGSRTTPSVVSYKDDEILVGEPARRQQITAPESTIYSSKRFIGMKHAQAADEAAMVSYPVKASDNDRITFSVSNKEVSPEEVGAKVLQKLKKAAEDYLGSEVKQAVITVPAYFDNAQRQATKDAGTIAGLEVLRVINEPTAAALAYGLDKNNEHKIVVIDCGGGTTDISLLEVSEDAVEVIATDGDTHLGGEDFDAVLINYIADEFLNTDGIDLRKDTMALQRLKTEAEKVKKELSSVNEVEVNIPFITADSNGPKHLLVKITRAKFEALIESLVSRVFKCVDQVLKDAKMATEDVDEVLFVGGSTRIPLVGKRTTEYFGKEPNRSVNPDEIVALGAAVQGGILSGDEEGILLLDVTSLSLGLETLGGILTVLIPRNTTIPTRKSQVFSTAADNQTSVTIKVAQGERPMFDKNQLLATFNLDGLPPSPKGVPQIEVSFDIDANGIVGVTAKDMATGKDSHITVESSKLSEDEIYEMVKAAEDHAEDDNKRVEEINQFNTLDTLVHATAKTVEENKDSIDGKLDLEELEEALSDAKTVLEERNVESLKETTDKLQAVAHKMAEVLYSAQQGEDSSPEGAESAESAEDDEVVDVTGD